MVEQSRFESLTLSAIAAANAVGEIVTGALVAVAPAAGMLPSAYVTWRHMVDALGIDPWIAGALAFGVDALGVGIAATRASLPRLKLTQHHRALTMALYAYFGIVAVANICVSAQTSTSVSAGIFESALALLPFPVAQLMSVNSEAAGVKQAAELADAKDVADKATAAKERERERELANQHEINMTRLRSELKTAAKVVQPVPQPVQPAPQPAQPLPGRIDPVALAAAMVANPNATHAQLAQPFGVSASAVGKYLRNQKGKVNP